MSYPPPPSDSLPSSLELAFGRHTQDVQHGPYIVADHLKDLGLAGWTGRVMGFLHIFVRQLLFKELHRTDKPTKESVSERRFRLAVAMANAPITSYGAAFKIQRNLNDPMESIWWNPLEQSWLRFLARRETLPDYTRLYMSTPCELRASAEDLIAYLMER
jgi:hypothetical protein